MALVNILLPAGLGLDPTALRRMSGMVLSLALVPAAVEVVAVTVFSHFLMNLPWLWGVLLGWLSEYMPSSSYKILFFVILVY